LFVAAAMLVAIAFMRTVWGWAALIGLALVLAACGEDAETVAYEAGYADGWGEGRWAVCEEVGRVAPGVKAAVEACDGW
jgi:hypothetical protein